MFKICWVGDCMKGYNHSMLRYHEARQAATAGKEDYFLLGIAGLFVLLFLLMFIV